MNSLLTKQTLLLYLLVLGIQTSCMSQIYFPFSLQTFENIRKGDSLYTLGEYDNAATKYYDSEDAFPYSNRLIYIVADALLKSGQVNKSIHLLNAAAKQQNFHYFNLNLVNRNPLFKEIKKDSALGLSTYNLITANTHRYMTSDDSCKYYKLSRLLIKMKINDQKHRIGNASTNDIALRKNIDRHNFYVLDSIVNVHGSLGIKELGRSGFSAFMLLVQHQDQNLSFQLKVLKSLSSELSKGNIIESRYAMLLDRVNLATSKVQIFGTQLVYFTDQDDIMYAIPELLYNNKNLTVLRDYFGLPHINRYINDMNEYVRKNKTK